MIVTAGQMSMAASGDTWGISGPAFGFLFVLLCVLAAFAAQLLRVVVVWLGGPPHRELLRTELAYLAGGPRRAVASAVATLRAAGAIYASGPAGMHVTAPPPDYAEPLEHAVHHTVASGEARTMNSLPSHPNVTIALAQVLDSLRELGMLLSPARRRWARLATLPLWVLLVIGYARWVTVLADGGSIGFLTVVLVVLTVITLTMTIRVPLYAGAGRRTVRDMRRRYLYLTPRQSPAWDTYGPQSAGVGVGLYGPTVLYSIDASFAACAGVEQQSSGSDSGGWSSGSSYGGASSACGGSGSSCGGSSSSSGGSSSSCGGSSSSSSSSSCGGGSSSG